MEQPDRDALGVLYMVVCAAPSARSIQDFILLARKAYWDVYTFATPQATTFVDTSQITEITGHPVQSEYELLEELDTLPEADAIVVAPATFATINQWALGTGESLAVSILCEGSSRGTPMVVAPQIRPDLAQHPAFSKSLMQLSQWNVRVLYEPEVSPSSNMVSWESILDELRRMQQEQYQHPAIHSAPFPEEIPTAAAAEKYDLTPSYVARLARTGIVRARRFGRDWIVDEEALRTYLAQPRKPGPKPRTVKVYRGWRGVDASTHVTVNGNPLPPFNTHGPRPPKSIRFEWGYYGSGPSELAVAILADYFSEKSPQGWVNRQTSRAMKYSDAFKSAFIGKLPRDSWELTSEQIHQWLDKLKEDKGQATVDQTEDAYSSEAT